jgi:phosphoserine phosphatase
MSARRVDAKALLEILERASTEDASGLAFDADGTLWSGDVGEDVFEHALEHDLLRPDALGPLEKLAARYGLPTPAGARATHLAREIYAAYQRGIVPTLAACEMMTWSYAGFTVDELRELSRSVFDARDLRGRKRRVLDPVFDWATRQGARVVVVSASPFPIVEEGLRAVGVEVRELSAARPGLDGARIEPALAEPIPYGPVKRVTGARLLGGCDWLGSFGDNGFDVEMLRAARVGVAVCPKPALVERLTELENTVVLE